VISALVLGLVGLFQADVVGQGAAAERGESAPPAVVVVALPANANRAILEALNRLRGEAISVGFEVRFVDAATESMTLAQLDGLSQGLRSAAVVAFAGPEDGSKTAHSLDVWFLDRATGKTSVAHLAAEEYADATDRGEVVLAVRAVDFIRARMFDTLAGRQAEAIPPEARPDSAHLRRGYLGAGMTVLGGTLGFSPSLAPQIEAGYRWTDWGRIGVTGFGFGSQAQNLGAAARINLDPHFVGASLTLLGGTWRSLQPALEVGVGEFWVRVRSQVQSPSVGQEQDLTMSSLAANVALGVTVNLLPYLMLEVRGGTLWLQRQVIVNFNDTTYLGTLGRPAWLGSARLGISF
jgi:hypothetical protein